MPFLRNPWFIALAATAAMAAYGVMGSPVSMLVLGTPWYLCALAWAWSEKYDAATLGAAVSPRGSVVTFYVAAGLAVAALAYLVWGRITDTGLIGWFDAIQARSDGRYSPKLSFVIGLLYVLETFLLVIVAEQWLAQWLANRRRPAARPATRVLP